MRSRRHEDGIFTLSIADICVCLAVEDANLMEQIRNRYKLYTTECEGVHRLSLHIANDIHGSAEEEIDLSESGLAITHQTYKGMVDFKSDASILELKRAHALADLEYFLRLVYAYLGFQAGGFLIHSAGVVKAERAYLFIGPSGSGKSTVAVLSSQHLVLNDDLVMLLPGEDHWVAYSTPFWNRGRGQNAPPRRAPVSGMYRLVKDRQNFLEKITTGEALADLMACIPVLPRSAGFSAGLFQRCSALLEKVPVYHLHFTPETLFWSVIEAEQF
jgi:hypothetical protein